MCAVFQAFAGKEFKMTTNKNDRKLTVLQPFMTCLADASLKVWFSTQSFGDAISTQWPCYSYP